MIKSIIFDWGGVIAPSAKIVTAEKLGINTIYFDNINQFKKELFNSIQPKPH